jgi:hypothetical protein
MRKRGRRRLRRSAGANAVVRLALGRDDRRDSDVADGIARANTVEMMKAIADGCQLSARSRPAVDEIRL